MSGETTAWGPLFEWICRRRAVTEERKTEHPVNPVALETFLSSDEKEFDPLQGSFEPFTEDELELAWSLLKRRQMYPLYCVLPMERYIQPTNYSLVIMEDDMAMAAYRFAMQSQLILVDTKVKDSSLTTTSASTTSSDATMIDSAATDDDYTICSEWKTLEQIGDLFGFKYTPFLSYVHEKELREIHQQRFGVFLSSDDLTESDDFHDHDQEMIANLSIGHVEMEEMNHNKFTSLHSGRMLRLFIQFGILNPYLRVSPVTVNGVDVGNGLFVTKDLLPGEFIGEYVGMVGSSSSHGNHAYCCDYPSACGSFQIDALECGNLIRFINHSSTHPNVELQRVVGLDLLIHIVCISTRPLKAGEQLFLNYGTSYWQFAGYDDVGIPE